MERISKNFTMSEFAASPTAQQRGIDNTIPVNVKPAIRALVHGVLQPLRTSFGLPCIVTSGYRSHALNAAVGGATNSQHIHGEAADCALMRAGARIPVIEIARRLVDLDLPFDQIVLYDNNRIHISHTVQRTNRRDVRYHSSYRGERL